MGSDTPSHAARSVLRAILAGLKSHPRPDGLGKIIQIAAAKSEMGTSFVARNLAEIAAAEAAYNAKRVGLVDCDFLQLAQTKHYFAAHRAGDVHGPYDATFGSTGYWQVSNQNGQTRAQPNIGAVYIDNKTDLAFTSFFWDQLGAGDQLSFFPNSAYWQLLRSQFSMIFVDMPAFDRNADCLALAPFVDSTVLVALADDGNDPAHQYLRDQIIAVGGRYEGLILNAGAPLRVLQTAQ